MNSLALTATKEFTWDCAHMLAGHEGLCKNLHGHTYKMLVTAAMKHELVIAAGPSKGMVLDFKDLKNYVKELIVDPLDHATIIDISNVDEFETGLYHLLKAHNKKVFEVKYRPTAENMALAFFEALNSNLLDAHAEFEIVGIRLYETPTSYAEVIK